MIKMVLKRFDRTVELNVPAEYEHVLLCLWRLGLDRDPAKYTIRQLEAVFSYDTPEEHQMIRLIDAGDTLLDALVLLHQMMVLPYPIAVRVRAKILSGAYQSGVSFAADMDDLISKEAEYGNGCSAHLNLSFILCTERNYTMNCLFAGSHLNRVRQTFRATTRLRSHFGS